MQEGRVGSQKPCISISILAGKVLYHNKKASECSKEPELPSMSRNPSCVNIKELVLDFFSTEKKTLHIRQLKFKTIYDLERT